MEIIVNNGTLKQWDTGRTVQITLDEGYKLQQVAFSCPRAAGPVLVNPDENNKADIPDGLLRHAGMLTVNAMLTDPDGKRLTRSKDFPVAVAVLPEGYTGGTGGGGGSTSKYQQPDWGSETAIVELLPEATYTIPTDNDPMVALEGFSGLVKGNEYVVNWNGTEHTYTAVNVHDYVGYEGTTEQIAIGNLGAAGIPGVEDDGNPYVIMTDVDANATVLIVIDGSASVTLSIKGGGEVIHAIPAKYTDNVMRVTVANDMTADKTFDEISAAINSGVFVYVFCDMFGDLTEYGYVVFTLAQFTDVGIAFYNGSFSRLLSYKSDGTIEISGVG